MKEVRMDLWQAHKEGKWCVITTNGFVKKNGEAVMGAGTAYQAKSRYPTLPSRLGEYIQAMGNTVFHFPDCKILTLPVKDNWWEEAKIPLIITSCKRLKDVMLVVGIEEVYMPRPGCGNGGLRWDEVFPAINPILDDRFTVVNL